MRIKIIYLMMFILLSSFAYAGLTPGVNQTLDYNFTDASPFIDVINGFRCTTNGGANRTQTYPTYNISGDGSPSAIFSDDEDGNCNSTNTALNIGMVDDESANTCAWWTRHDSVIGDANAMWGTSVNLVWRFDNAKIQANVYGSWTTVINTVGTTWFFNAIVKSSGNAVCYLGDTNSGNLNSTACNKGTTDGGNDFCILDDNCDGSNGLKGAIDDFQCWDGELDPTNITHLFNFGRIAVAAPAVITPAIDIIFRNESDQITTNFDIGEEFITQVVYNLSNGTVLTNETSNCTIGLIGAFVEIEGDFANFTLCDSGCNFTSRKKQFNFSFLNAVNDSIHFEGCHEQTASGDMEIIFSCVAGSESVFITAAEMPLCSEGTAFIRKGSDVCIGGDVNISTNTSGNIPFSQRKRILNAAADREYSTMVMEYTTEVFWNSTVSAFQTDHLHEYYTPGTKTAFANCTTTLGDFNLNESENITIINAPPAVFIEQIIMPDSSVIDLSDGLEIEFQNGTWQFLVAATNGDLDATNFTIFNVTPEVVFTETNLSNLFVSSDIFLDFQGNDFILNLTANDTGGLQASVQISITINDTQDPECPFPSSFELEEGNNLDFNIICTDENFFLLNVSCPANNFSFFVDGLNTESYLFNQTISDVVPDSCQFEYCDGHTAEELEKEWTVIIENQTFEFYVDYESKAKLWIDNKDALLSYEKKHDRIEYTIRLSKSDVKLYHTIYYQASANSHYLFDEKYRGWIVDTPSRIWNDLNNVPGELQVFNHKDGLWEFRIYTDSKLLEFKSIGELNCVEGSFDMVVMLNPERTNEFESLEQGIFWMFLIMLWVVFVILLFTVKGANGKTVGLFNVFQTILGVVVGIGFLQFSVILGFLIVLTAAFLFIGKAMENS